MLKFWTQSGLRLDCLEIQLEWGLVAEDGIEPSTLGL